MAERMTDEDLELLEELGVDTAPAASGGRSPREQRIIAGFEEIERFVEEHGRLPQHDESRDIFERLYAVRLAQIRELQECREVLKGLDSRGLLNESGEAQLQDNLSDEELLASLGVVATPENDITNLQHVRSTRTIKAADEITRRNPCEEFHKYKPLFEKVQRDLANGDRRTIEFYGGRTEIEKGDWFILEGQKLLVVDVGDTFVSNYDRTNCRLHVVFDNGTESQPLLRSLQRALYEDKTSRRITNPTPLPLFADTEEDGDLAAGSIYVLRSKSNHPFVAEHRSVLHKIGVTGGDVKSRIANAKNEPTYLLADVEVVATFKLSNINRKAMEGLLHKFFGNARLDLELKDRFGGQVEPKEWFLVPLPVIDEAIQKIKDGTIENYRYEPETARLVFT